MMNVLLESKASPTHRRGGTAISLVVHGSIIFAVAAATATGTSAREPEPPVETEIIYVAPKQQEPVQSAPVPRQSASSRSTPSSATPVAPISFDFSVVPSTIPTGALTSIDLGRDPGAERSGNPLVPGGVYSRGESIGSDPYRAVDVDRTASLLETVTPRYPERLRNAGITGRVTVRFVIDTLGRVERESLQVLSSAHLEFTAAVRAALEKMRFRPAEAAGRRVRMLVEMPFEFALR